MTNRLLNLCFNSTDEKYKHLCPYFSNRVKQHKRYHGDFTPIEVVSILTLQKLF